MPRYVNARSSPAWRCRMSRVNMTAEHSPSKQWPWVATTIFRIRPDVSREVRDVDTRRPRAGDRLLVARVGVTDHAHARIAREDPLEALRRLRRTVRDDDHAC